LTPDQIKDRALQAQESAQLESRLSDTVENVFPIDEEEDDLAGGPAERDRLAKETAREEFAEAESTAEALYGKDPIAGDRAKQNQERVQAMYEKTQEGGLYGGPLYKKGRYLYEYDKDLGVWTVYTSRLGYATRRPLTKDGKKEGEPVRFSMEEAVKNNNPNVRELYDLAIAEGMVPE